MNGKWPGAPTAEIIESLSDEEFWRYARELALLTPTETLPPEYLRCELSGGRCLIPMTSLYEVVPPPHRFAFLPAIPAWMRGVFAWHTETIAVVDLDAYLSANMPQPVHDPDQSSWNNKDLIHKASTDTLLIADHSGLPIGLLVPTTGLTTTPESMSEDEESRSPILDLPVVLMDIVQQIRNSCPL
jgi:chemotaxis signal transduction protein